MARSRRKCDRARCGKRGVAEADNENRRRASGLGYGDLKKALFEHYWNFLAPYRARRAELVANPDYVDQVLCEGAARAVGEQTLARARKNCGLR